MSDSATWDKLTPFGKQQMTRYFEPKRTQAYASADVSKARLYYPDAVEHYEDQRLAYQVWLNMPHGVRIAFRGVGDETPVHSWDLVDKP